MPSLLPSRSNRSIPSLLPSSCSVKYLCRAEEQEQENPLLKERDREIAKLYDEISEVYLHVDPATLKRVTVNRAQKKDVAEWSRPDNRARYGNVVNNCV